MRVVVLTSHPANNRVIRNEHFFSSIVNCLRFVKIRGVMIVDEFFFAREPFVSVDESSDRCQLNHEAFELIKN